MSPIQVQARAAVLNKRDVPRTDTKGIVNPAAGLATFDMRRRIAAPELSPFVEHYWLIDWDLVVPYEQEVIPHPCVNIVFQRPHAVVSGQASRIFAKKLVGADRVVGVQFRPAGFHPFLRRPLTELTDRIVALGELFPDDDTVLGCATDDDAVAAVDSYLLSLAPARDPVAERVAAVREDGAVIRVDDLAARFEVTSRQLQRLFGEYVGVTPKWVIRRYRIHEAAERLAAGADLATVAAELGYSDQAHFTRDFTTVTGRTPAGYRQENQESTAPIAD